MNKLVSALIIFLFICGIVYPSNGDFILIIDAGHGGRDPGALRGSIKEKDINLAVAIEFGRLVEQNLQDVNVQYTRKTDKYLDPKDRANFANKIKANLFISIHTNSTNARTTSAKGADTYILGLAKSIENMAVARRENSVIKLEEDYTTKYEGFDPDSPESYIIFEFMSNQYLEQSFNVASYIQKDFKAVAKRIDRGVNQAGFLVLREVAMPSILIELGFINNPNEAKYLSSAEGQKTMASAIYSGFKKYKEDYDKKDGGIIRQEEAKTQQPKNTKPTATATDHSTTAPNSTNRNEPPATIPSNTKPTGTIEYRVQFLYSPTKLPDNSPRFKGLKGVSYYVDKGYKYTVGSAIRQEEIQALFRQVKKDFNDAFIIQMKDGKRFK